jgi:peptidoglycan/xylan/chitin deacetylase (PgdA/CDA1 family)
MAILFAHKTPGLLKMLYPRLTWEIPTSEKQIFLTFDDGPIPEVSEFVLETLAKFHAKATFFSVGENISKHPEIYRKILEEGHLSGNHTYNHLNGWKTETKIYLDNVAECTSEIERISGLKPVFFRPPYGRIKKMQIQMLKKNYRVIMWSLLTGDFHPKLTEKQCLQKSISGTKPGSIVVFHDSIKSIRLLRNVLPAYLKYFQEQGYVFSRLDEGFNN